MATNYVLIDFENVQPSNLAVLQALCKTVYRTEPILLFDGPEEILPGPSSHQALVQFICKISEICQCLCVSHRIDIFPDDISGKVYTDSELIGKTLAPYP